MPSNTVLGRIIHLNPPSGDMRGPVTSGTAIVETGDFLGQRVEFDRSVCSAFGFPLQKADLSHLIRQGEIPISCLFNLCKKIQEKKCS